MSYLRKSKRSKPVDTWLDTLGLYRKNVAYDETSLFRAISEQIFESQVFHERVRKECIEFARRNLDKLVDVMENEERWSKHLDMLGKHMVVCGNIEIQIVSKKYNYDVIIYDSRTKQVIDATKRNLANKFSLCLTDQDHYDVIYSKEYIDNSGFCQSIVYKILYEEVFEIQNVDEIVITMLHENSNNQNLLFPKEENKENMYNDEDKILPLMPPISNNNIAPFPFKVAKALDPTIYRNIEYDSWGELRKEYRLGEWYYGDDKLTLGTKCIYTDPENKYVYECYIQQILKNENKCVVYLTSSAEKRTVSYSDLSPETDAKPWPLPYRFSKNLTISSHLHQSPVMRKITKRGEREMRRSKSCSEDISLETRPHSVASSELAAEHVKAYVGAPLQKQKSKPPLPVCEVPDQQVPENFQNQSHQQDMTYLSPMTPITPESSQPRFHYDQQPNPWGYYMTPTTNPFVWLPVPQSPHNYNYNIRHMPASAPTTPNILPYSDMCNQSCAAYNMGQCSSYQQLQKPANTEQQCKSPQAYETLQNDAKPSEVYYQVGYTEQNCATAERLTLMTNLTPANTPVETYSPVILFPQVSYTPEIINPVPMYPIHHPSTPTAMYPPGVTAQGFYFPPPPAQ